MRLHRFFTKTPIKNKSFDVTDEDLIHQWKSVFRYNVGSQVIMFDGFGTDYLCLISSLRNKGATLAVVREMKDEKNLRKINLWLCLGIIKKDNFELVVEKATELGVAHIVPILCDRSEKKNLNMERLNKIAIEATEQSGRVDVPFIHEMVKLPDLLKGDLLPNSAIFLDMSGKPIFEIINAGQKELAVFVGPEGGWSGGEEKEFASCNVLPVSLGSQVLRAETASIAISSLLLL